MKTARTTCLAIATLLTFGSVVRAQSSTHIDELALQAERQARRVLYQTYSLNNCGPAARELRSDAVQLIRLARHIHDLAHVDHHVAYGRHRVQGQINRTAHINRDLADLDRLMHHMQDVVLELKARTPVRSTRYDRYGHGNVNVAIGNHFSLSFGNSRVGNRYHPHGSYYRAPSPLDRIEISLAKLSDTVHHLLEDTDVVCIGKR